MKCEPDAYTIEDLEREGSTSWEGVRNYQARNFMRDEMRKGDGVLFYASNADPSGVTGLATVVRAGYPDHSAWTKGETYFDPDSTQDAPTWFMVDIGFVETFPEVVSLATLKATRGLEAMKVTQKGSRLSVQPVTRSEYDVVVKLGRGKAKKAAGAKQAAGAKKARAKQATAVRGGRRARQARDGSAARRRR
jgi:predicted RNA-binding protein with PUA-like domain